jgi:hypothetical protein
MARNELVQRLVADVLLLDNRKFDVRVFVLIASTLPLQVYVHREPYFRASMRRFDSDQGSQPLSQKSKHVTNTHIQKRTGNFTSKDWQDHIWTADRVDELAKKARLADDFCTGTFGRCGTGAASSGTRGGSCSTRSAGRP